MTQLPGGTVICDGCHVWNVGARELPDGRHVCGRASCLQAVYLPQQRSPRKRALAWMVIVLLALVGIGLAASDARSALPQTKPKPWKVVNVIDEAEGWNYIAIYTDRRNALATGRFLATRGTWRDARRLFNASFVLDARHLVSIRRLGRLIVRAAQRGRFVVYRSENGGYPFAPFAPEPTAGRP